MRFQRVRVKILKKTGCESLNCSCPVVVAGPGDVFGELALLYNCPRAASVEASGRPIILMYFASVWIRLLVVDSWHQTLAAPTARKATEEAVVWQLDRETFSHIVRDASAKRREAFQDFLNLGKAWRGVSRSSYVVGSWNNGVSEIARMCSWMFVTCTQLLLAHIAFMDIYGMWPRGRRCHFSSLWRAMTWCTQLSVSAILVHEVMEYLPSLPTKAVGWLLAAGEPGRWTEPWQNVAWAMWPHQVWHESSSG